MKQISNSWYSYWSIKTSVLICANTHIFVIKYHTESFALKIFLEISRQCVLKLCSLHVNRKSLQKTNAGRRWVYYPYVNYKVNCNPYKISYDQSDIWLSYLDIVCCGIPANCLRSQPGHNYALHWTRSSRRRLSLRICYWGFRLSFPRGLGQLQPSMAGRKTIQLLHLKPFFQQYDIHCMDG